MDNEMEHLHGPLRKMIATAESPVSYRLPIGEVELPLNACLGRPCVLDIQGAITCIACGQRTKKSFQPRLLFPLRQDAGAVRSLHGQTGTLSFCPRHLPRTGVGTRQLYAAALRYLANSSGLKMGMTRTSQIPTRRIGQICRNRLFLQAFHEGRTDAASL